MYSKRPHAYAFRISCNMTDGDVLRRAALIAGEGMVTGPCQPKNPAHTPFYRWNLNKRSSIYALLVAIFPWMGSRRKARILEMIALLKSTGRLGWRHGTRQGYETGCRCAACRAAHAKRFREIRARRHLAAS